MRADRDSFFPSELVVRSLHLAFRDPSFTLLRSKETYNFRFFAGTCPCLCLACACSCGRHSLIMLPTPPGLVKNFCEEIPYNDAASGSNLGHAVACEKQGVREPLADQFNPVARTRPAATGFWPGWEPWIPSLSLTVRCRPLSIPVWAAWSLPRCSSWLSNG